MGLCHHDMAYSQAVDVEQGLHMGEEGGGGGSCKYIE